MKRSTISRAVMRTIVDAIESGGATEEPPEGDETVDPDGDDDENEEPDGGIDAERLLAKVRKTNSENRALRERAKQAEAQANAAGDASKRADELESENLRLKLALKHGIPEQLLPRLKGSTEDELLADAQELMELFEAKKPPTRKPQEKRNPGSDRRDDEVKSLDDLAADMFRD